jgi:hypothetical protein
MKSDRLKAKGKQQIEVEDAQRVERHFLVKLDSAPYGAMPDDNSIFARMELFQRAAAISLVQSGHLSAEAWETDEVAFTTLQLPTLLAARCTTLNVRMADIMNILCQIQARYTLGGRDGLKDRTGLLEYRYDSV